MLRGLKRTTPWLGLVTAACAGWLATGLLDGPWGMVPGGRLEGPSTPCGTERWERFASQREVEVEVRPRHPRSVTTWSVVHQGELFLPADFLTPWKRWPHEVAADPNVRVRVGSRIFECRAERVADAELIEQLRLAAASKYDLQERGPEADIEVWWFRVRPR